MSISPPAAEAPRASVSPDADQASGNEQSLSRRIGGPDISPWQEDGKGKGREFPAVVQREADPGISRRPLHAFADDPDGNCRLSRLDDGDGLQGVDGPGTRKDHHRRAVPLRSPVERRSVAALFRKLIAAQKYPAPDVSSRDRISRSMFVTA